MTRNIPVIKGCLPWRLIATLCVLLPTALSAQETQAAGEKPAPVAFTMQAELVGDTPYGRRDGEAPYPVTIYKRDTATRVDFRGPLGEQGMLLHDGKTRSGWMINLDEGIALPMDAPGIGDLTLDPEHPCKAMQARCQPSRSRFIAGVATHGWRYRDASGRGPGGTQDGEMWIDPAHGVVLAYRGRRKGWDRIQAMEASSVQYAPLAEALFKLPDTVIAPE